MSTLDQMEIFYFVAAWKSFSRAALELGVSKGYVSMQITALEKELGLKLLSRTTRHLNLTEEGNLFFESCTRIVHEKKQAVSLLKETQAEPAGHLKIAAPPSMCATFLAELLPKFQKEYPKISLTIDSSSKVKNLLQHGIDIALRVTHAPDERYIARLISTFRFTICASPDYLKHYGVPKKPSDLLSHNCLIYAADPAGKHWPFQQKNTTEVINVEGNLISTNCSIIQNAVLAGHGIARLPHYVLAKAISNKELEILFAEQMKIEMPVYALYASNVTIPLKVKRFIDFLKDHIRAY